MVNQNNFTNKNLKSFDNFSKIETSFNQTNKREDQARQVRISKEEKDKTLIFKPEDNDIKKLQKSLKEMDLLTKDNNDEINNQEINNSPRLNTSNNNINKMSNLSISMKSHKNKNENKTSKSNNSIKDSTINNLARNINEFMKNDSVDKSSKFSIHHYSDEEEDNVNSKDYNDNQIKNKKSNEEEQDEIKEDIEDIEEVQIKHNNMKNIQKNQDDDEDDGYGFEEDIDDENKGDKKEENENYDEGEFTADDKDLKKLERTAELANKDLDLDDYKEIHESQKIQSQLEFFEDSCVDGVNIGAYKTTQNKQVRPSSPKMKKNKKKIDDKKSKPKVNKEINPNLVSSELSVNLAEDSYGDNIINDLDKYRKFALEGMSSELEKKK